MHDFTTGPIVDAAWVEASVDRFDQQAKRPPEAVGFLLRVFGEEGAGKPER